jgi:hypothetical protein
MCKLHSFHSCKLIYFLLFIISLVLPISPDDSIQSTPYWDCNINNKPDTIINKVVQRKDYKGKPYVEVYYKVSQFRKPSTFWVKVYK